MPMIEVSAETYQAIHRAQKAGHHHSTNTTIRAACAYYLTQVLKPDKRKSARAMLEDAVERGKLLA